MKESQSTLTEQSSLLRCNNNKKKSEGKSVKQKHTAHKFISDALIPELFVRDWIIPVGYWTASCTNHIWITFMRLICTLRTTIKMNKA